MVVAFEKYENNMIKLITFLALLLILGCEDKKEDKILEADALLRWDGDYSYDGCGFFIVISENEYKPEDEVVIDDSFKVYGGVDVFIKYELLNETIEYYCGMMPSELDGIKLHSIENR